VDSSRAIAEAFVAARRAAAALLNYPGEVPETLDTAYAIQDAAIGLWGEEIAGWKIGRIPPSDAARLGGDRLAGPAFRSLVWLARENATHAFPVFARGFAAVEAEFVYRIGANAPVGKAEWTMDEALTLVDALHIGVELAGSPLATINALGPTVVISDFGNNHGLIVGPEITDWRGRADCELISETLIDGVSVGRGSAANVLGGPLASLAFVAANAARRDRPLKAGQFITTGATTGIHPIAIGQDALVKFGEHGEIRCVAEKAAAHEKMRHAVQS